jgi:hypothetical protein
VDNVVDKTLLPPHTPRIHAVYIKLPIRKAKKYPNKINGLAALAFCPTTCDEAYSYKIPQQGISLKKVHKYKRFIHLELL